jgi:hypothetical protein
VPVAFEGVPGTPFAVAIVGVPATPSGPASASLVAGVGSILVTLVVGCFAALGAKGGWGPLVSGAFAALAGFAGVAAVVLSQVARRQVRRAPGRITGGGVAIAGLVCGLAGLALTAVAFVIAVVAAASGPADLG